VYGAEFWRSVEFDDVRILFQAQAGKCHFLNAISAFILDLLTEGPLCFQGMCAALSQELGAELTSEQITQLANHIQRLEALGLIARSRSISE
jgi:PqqD family protein of HPr-rel-A system